MSRTRRFKNYELVNNSSWDRRGKKTALSHTGYNLAECKECGTFHGYTISDDIPKGYTGYVYHSMWDGRPLRYVYCKNHHVDGYYDFYEMKGRERFKNIRFMHGDTSGHGRRPTWWYRHVRIRELRQYNKNEIFKYMKNPDEYEPLCNAEPKDCWYDWD